jgi:hypothetical protein
MTQPAEPVPASAYVALDPGAFRSTALTRGPWHPDHQHAGPPIALACRSVERAAREHGLTHVSRLTANLYRPVPLADLAIAVAADYVGRNAGHFSARILAAGKEVVRLTALAQRESDVKLPEATPGEVALVMPRAPQDSPPATFPFAGRHVGYAELMEGRVARGRFFAGPCAVWFRMRHPLVEGEAPSAYERVAVAADSGNGISAVLDFARYSFVNSDLTINLLRRPEGEWIGLDARTALDPSGCGIAESTLFDTNGFVGRATQSLSIRLRDGSGR